MVYSLLFAFFFLHLSLRLVLVPITSKNPYRPGFRFVPPKRHGTMDEIRPKSFYFTIPDPNNNTGISCDIPWLFPKISPGAPPHNHRTNIMSVCSNRGSSSSPPLRPSLAHSHHSVTHDRASLSNVRRAPSSKSSRSPALPRSLFLSLRPSLAVYTLQPVYRRRSSKPR